ncbi:helix-turn-helix transcriptional regulator [Hyphomonas johnsonii]|uniref:DNA-binding protein n=1 Tax=Hyphomonas johnsonii MHS-2 TaxID=1280950 RepID=A0A059FUF8_9PROT|nr:helix-turn-helix transcriptional regulator [Hyphomonas johnsonii]KCZ94314.1 DNA-binding protein [Hyphomonas johnsonii MHS-2]
MGDQDLIYGFEGRLIDLETKVNELEKRVAELSAAPPSVPASVQTRIDAGEHPVRVMREFRLLTQSQLSEKCGIRPNHISAIERGQTFGLKTAKRLAAALEIPAEVLF